MNSFKLSRSTRRIGLVALIVVALGAVSACAGLEFGARPASSVRAPVVGPDVKFVQANGLRFAYLEEGVGPLILLMHGYPEAPTAWQGVRHRLAGAGYRVVTPYSRGYAPTASPANGDYGLASLGKDVADLIGALGEQSAVVVGHDWGASAAYAAATAHPEKVRQLVAISVPHLRGLAGDRSFLLEAPHFLYYQFPWAERLLWSHDFAHIERIYERGAPHWQAPSQVVEQAKALMRSPGAVETAIGYYQAVFKGNTRDPKAAQQPIAVPTLVISGAADGNFKRPRFDKAAAAFTNRYEFVALPGVGHYPQWEAPDATADAILAFLQPKPSGPLTP